MALFDRTTHEGDQPSVRRLFVARQKKKAIAKRIRSSKLQCIINTDEQQLKRS
jgi:hypothetical protein